MRRQSLALPALPTCYGIEPRTLPGYQLSFLCAGRTFRAFVRARNQRAAVEEGILELATQCPDFEPDDARLVACIETH